MKLISYKISDSKNHQIGVIKDTVIYNLNSCFGDISLIEMFQIKNYQDRIALGISNNDFIKHDLDKITLLPPIPTPNSFRDAYAFREHVETSRKNIVKIGGT